jgi:glutathione S-transferase
MSQPLVFYDILVDPTGQDRQCWSANTWKTRLVSWQSLFFLVLTVAACTSLALNYKKVPYTTVWVQYSDIQTVLKEIGATPTDKRPTGEDRYTLPTIRNPATGEVISDSAKIIAYLEEKYPERPLIPQGTLEQQVAFSNQIIGVVGFVNPIWHLSSRPYLTARCAGSNRVLREARPCTDEPI